MKQITEKVTINGEEYEIKGNIDFSDITVTKIDSNVPDPEPPVDTGAPSEGLIKPGGWGADLTNKDNWKVIAMKDNPALWKVVDAAGKNVATSFTAKEVAESFINYYKSHPFPPVDTVPNPDEPAPGPEVPPTPQSGTDKFGTKLLVSDGKVIEYKFRENFRPDGKRFDFVMEGCAQSEAQGYFRFTKDPVDDEVSIKWSEKTHSGDGAQVQCYDSGVEIKGNGGKARVRLRFENPHPDYSGNLGKGEGVPLNDKFIGYKGTKVVNKDGTVTIELYQDAGENEGEKPSNSWTKIFSYTDSEYKRTGPHPFVTMRVDDPAKKGQKNLEAKWLSVAKI